MIAVNDKPAVNKKPSAQEVRQSIGAWYAEERDKLKDRAAALRVLAESYDRGDVSDRAARLAEIETLMGAPRV